MLTKQGTGRAEGTAGVKAVKARVAFKPMRTTKSRVISPREV